MTRQAWLLFAAMSVIWGIPYLMIKVAVTELSPAAVAGSRTLLAAVILLPLAAHQKALRPALALWKWVVAFGLLEMAGPWLLLGHAETRVSSGFAGLMLATVDRRLEGPLLHTRLLPTIAEDIVRTEFAILHFGPRILKKKDGSPRAPVKAGRLTIEDVLWLYDVIDEVKEELQSQAGPQ